MLVLMASCHAMLLFLVVLIVDSSGTSIAMRWVTLSYSR